MNRFCAVLIEMDPAPARWWGNERLISVSAGRFHLTFRIYPDLP